MSDHKDQPNHEFSVDDILAEFGSGSHKTAPSKVVEFPQPPPPFDEQPPVMPPPSGREPEAMDEIVPETAGRKLAARLSTLLRRADHYADHMYDRAEPDDATKRAEKYIPGTDREEIPEEPLRPHRKSRPPQQLPPDTAPTDLAAQYRKELKGRKGRVALTFVAGLLSVLISLELPFLNWVLSPESAALRLMLLAAMLLVAGLLAYDLLVCGFVQLFRLHPNAEALMALGWLFTLADAVVLMLTHYRQGLPCCAVTSLGLAFSLWGDCQRRRGDLLSAKTASQARMPYTVTLDENKWSGRPAYSKWSGSTVGFGSQLQMEDCVRRAYRVAAPLLLLGCLLASVMTAAAQSAAPCFLWAMSACLTASASWTALLSYGLPYRKLASRLSRQGAALAGWPGVSRCRQGGILITDEDLFPAGSIKVSQAQIYGGVSTEKAVAYTATVLRASHCGLSGPFHDLLRSQGAFYRETSGLVAHEGGYSAIIRNQEVLVGTAAFMHMMDITLPQGIKIKNAVFCAIDGELAGLFPLQYTMNVTVNPSLSALMHEEVSPILVTRDFNLIPALLEQKFKLSVERIEFPPVERRMELSHPEQEHDTTPVAVLCREGLSVYSDAVAGGRRLRSAARRSLVFTLISAVIGLCLTFYLTFVGAASSLTPVNFLIFMAAWLVPELLIANWVNQF